jgi:hypothetical protein
LPVFGEFFAGFDLRHFRQMRSSIRIGNFRVRLPVA